MNGGRPEIRIEDGVSVVIPSHRGAESGDSERFAALCLDSVCASVERWRGRKEVVIGVDRALSSKRGDRDFLVRLRKRYPFVRLVRNPGLPGGPRARMLALNETRHSTVLFTDDDCVVPPDWVERMTEGARRFGVFTGGVASVDPALAGARPEKVSDLWRMEEIIDRYRLVAVDHSGRTRYVSFPNLAIRRELLPEVPFDSIFAFSADDMDLGYRIRLNGIRIQADLDGFPVRTAYPRTLLEAMKRKLRHARGIAYVHRRMGPARLQSLEPGSWIRIVGRWIRISLRAPMRWRERAVFLLLNLTYCLGLGWYLMRLRGAREFALEEIRVRQKTGTRPSVARGLARRLREAEAKSGISSET